jgi:hypothetical protein
MKIKLKGCFEILGARRGSQGREIKKKKKEKIIGAKSELC